MKFSWILSYKMILKMSGMWIDDAYIECFLRQQQKKIPTQFLTIYMLFLFLFYFKLLKYDKLIDLNDIE